MSEKDDWETFTSRFKKDQDLTPEQRARNETWRQEIEAMMQEKVDRLRPYHKQWRRKHPASSLLWNLSRPEDTDPGGRHTRAARAVLEEEKKDRAWLSDDHVDRLAREIHNHERKAWVALGLDKLEELVQEELDRQAQAEGFDNWQDASKKYDLRSKDYEGLCQKAAGIDAQDQTMFPLDRLAADFLEGLGKEGRGTAAEVRDASKKRWTQRGQEDVDLWRQWRTPDNGVLIFRWNLARAVWHDLVKPLLERERGTYPAVSRPVAVSLIGTTSRQAKIVEYNGDYRINLGSNTFAHLPGETIREQWRQKCGTACATDTAVRHLLDGYAATLSSIYAHSAVRWLIWRGYRLWQGLLDGELTRETERIELVGGYQELAKLVGARGAKGAHGVQMALEALEACRFAVPNYPSLWLIAVEREQSTRGQQSRLVVTVNWPLLPIGLSKLTGSDSLGVPIPPPDRLPMSVLNRQDKAREAELHLRVMEHCADRSHKLVKEGCFRSLDQPKSWDDLLDASKIARKYRNAIMAAYYAPTGGLWPVLKKTSHGPILADPMAHDFLVEQGKRRLARSQAGKAGARKRKPVK